MKATMENFNIASIFTMHVLYKNVATVVHPKFQIYKILLMIQVILSLGSDIFHVFLFYSCTGSGYLGGNIVHSDLPTF